MSDFLPPLFIERIRKFLPDSEMDSFIQSYERDFIPSLRSNPLKITDNEFWKIFSEQSKEPVSWCPDGYFIQRKSPFTKTPYYHAGLFYIQEASSMLPVEVLNPQPGEKILDVCASPGSKTTQIIARMQNQGLLIANEIRRDRIGRLMENVIRWGSRNTIVTNQASSAFFPMVEFFDRILVDAPCSGEGMFKKDPEALKHWGLQNIKVCASLQKQILRDIIPALKTGGILVYSTCTMAPEENEETVQWILKAYPGCFALEEISFGDDGITQFEDKQYLSDLKKTRRMWPHKIKSEGFFITRLKKIAPVDSADSRIKPSSKSFIQEAPYKLLNDFFQSIKQKPLKDCFKIGYKIYSWGALQRKEVELYLNQIKPVYLGVHVGDEKKNRIEPAHALALSFLKSDLNSEMSVELNLDLTVQYLRGAEIPMSLNQKDGFKVITYQGYPLGWANYKGGKLKNFFPHSMRNKL